MHTTIKVHHLKIDSSRIPSYYNDYKTSFLYQLSETISCDMGESILYSLISATIPYTFYGLNKFNDKLDVRETIGGVVKPVRTVTISHGNYDAYSFASYFIIK